MRCHFFVEWLDPILGPTPGTPSTWSGFINLSKFCSWSPSLGLRQASCLAVMKPIKPLKLCVRLDRFSMKGPKALLVEAEELLVGFERSPAIRVSNASGWHPDEAADYCRSCGQGTWSHRFNCDCVDGVGHPFSSVFRLGAYERPLSDWICMVKFERWNSMGTLLGGLIAQGLQASVRPEGSGVRTPLLVPVPMPRLRMFSRGIDHTRVLAEKVAAVTGWPTLRCLRQRAGRPQASSTARQRSGRANPFTLKGKPKTLVGRQVILVDDVMTTGRTARSAARILRGHGASDVMLAVVAVTESTGRG